MHRVGTAVRAPQGLVVLEAAGDPPAVGTAVLSESLEPVGEVVEYFGPVDRPYVLVSPRPEVSPATLIGSPLYAR